MPELPEVEITARLLDRELAGRRIESVSAPGINALKTFAPPLSALAGQHVTAVRRRGKNLILESGCSSTTSSPDRATGPRGCSSGWRARRASRTRSCGCGSSAPSRRPG
jgi:hypothetical protein